MIIVEKKLRTIIYFHHSTFQKSYFMMVKNHGLWRCYLCRLSAIDIACLPQYENLNLCIAK